MAKTSLVGGTTSYIATVFIEDSTSTTGAGKTGIVFNSAGLTAYYVRPGAAAVSITLATQTTTGAYSSGGFVEIDSVNMPGFYRLDIPNAVLAAGVKSAAIMLKGAAGMAPLALEFEVTGTDNQDATAGGISRIDAAISSRSTYAGADTAGTTTLLGRIPGTVQPQTGDGFARLGAPAGASVSADVAAVKADTGAVKTQTDKLTFTVPNQVDSNVLDWKSATAPAMPTNFAAFAIDASGRVSIAPAQLFYKKNTGAQQLSFLMTDATTHAPKTGLTVAATRSIDGAAFAGCANAVSEVGNGWYTITLAAADVNGLAIALRFTSAGADDRNMLVVTQA